MNIRHAVALSLITLVSSLLTPRAGAQNIPVASLDFDSDGRSELVTTTANGTGLSWDIVQSDFASSPETTLYQLATDVPVPGAWLTPGNARLATVRNDPQTNSLLWKIADSERTVRTFSFGAIGNYVAYGGDFDGNGILDAVTISPTKQTFRWTIRKNLAVSASPSDLSFVFGSFGDRAFFGRFGTTSDLPALFTPKRRLQIRQGTTATSSHLQSIPLPSSLVRGGVVPRPFKIPSTNSKVDLIGFLVPDTSDTRLLVYRPRISRSKLTLVKVIDRTLIGIGSFSVGNYDPELAGDEIAFFANGAITLINPITKTVRPLEGQSLKGPLVNASGVSPVP